jgi:hypothetical protein
MCYPKIILTELSASMMLKNDEMCTSFILSPNMELHDMSQVLETSQQVAIVWKAQILMLFFLFKLLLEVEEGVLSVSICV